MQIDRINTFSFPTDAVQEVVQLEQRVISEASNSAQNDDFDNLYSQLLDDLSQGLPAGTTLREYLRDYAGAEGGHPYNDSQKQVDVLSAVLQRMDKEGLKGDVRYGQLQSALSSATMINLFVMEFRSTVFNPEEDEDSRENAEW